MGLLGLRRRLFALHRWLGLFIGVQVAIWTGSGLVMALSPIERVRGEHLVAREAADPVAPAAGQLSPGEAAAIAGGEALEISLKSLHRRAVYAVTRRDGGRLLIDAADGRVLSPLSGELAEAIARAAYRGDASVRDVAWLTDPPIEYRQRAPVWRVRFADQEGTAVYVDPATGRIPAVRTDLWRVYDFLWGLHIADWREREDFNTPWLQALAGLALTLSLTGLYLAGARFAHGGRALRKPREEGAR